MAQAIHRLKYAGRPDLARPLARWMAQAEPQLARGVDGWVPVPLHPKRLAERGFNQAALIAAELSRIFGPRVYALALQRNTYMVSQAGLGRTQRLLNARSAFSARTNLAGQRVALVDDVLTTGATALACIEALHDAGAQAVGVVTLTRGGRQPVECAQTGKLM